MSATGNGTTSKVLNVLLIEDDPDFVRMMKLRLSKMKDPAYAVKCAFNLHAGLDYLSDTLYVARRKIDLVLLDLGLPESKGLETFTQVQAFAKDTPIIILTGYGNDRVAIDAVRQGAADYVVKSQVEGSVLLRLMRYAIERYRTQKKLDLTAQELQATNSHLEKIALHDSLTTLYNRRGLEQAVRREAQRAEKYGGMFLALLIDLDHFKRVNDTFGYGVGDLLLREVANALKQTLRLTDRVARIGGDEFIAILPKTEFHEGVKIAERVRLSISATTILLSGKNKLSITPSIGLVAVPKTVGSPDELIELAHPLVKRSKRGGGNRVFYEESGSIESKARIRGPLSHEKAMIQKGEGFTVVKQPIVALTSRKIVGYEFLSRLQNSLYHLPNDFFRFALENNILTLADRHCFTACVKAASSLNASLRSHLNLFPSTMINLPIEKLIAMLPEKRGRGSYCVEISEKQIIGDPSYLIDAVAAFKRAGVWIAADDVGFGHSSLESLIAFEPEVIKLDQRFVHQVAGDTRRLRSLERILKMARDMKARVIAEGIEFEADLEALRRMGVPYGQGFLLGKPAESSRTTQKSQQALTK